MPVKGKLYVTTEGGQVEGPLEDKGCFVFEFNHEVYLPYDKEDNQIQGGRRITCFEIVKEIDQMTPELYNLCCNGTMCTEVKFVLIRIAKGGTEEEYFYYTLKDARVVAVDNYMALTKLLVNEPLPHLERVKFLAREFTWKHKEGTEYTEAVIK